MLEVFALVALKNWHGDRVTSLKHDFVIMFINYMDFDKKLCSSIVKQVKIKYHHIFFMYDMVYSNSTFGFIKWLLSKFLGVCMSVQV